MTAACGAVMTAVLAGSAAAQDSSAVIVADGQSAVIVADGEPVRRWANAGADSLAKRAGAYVDSLRLAGFYFAELDSMGRQSGGPVAFVTRGELVTVSAVEVRGVDEAQQAAMLGMMDTRPGGVLDLATLEADIVRMLRSYVRSGHVLASASVEELPDLSGDPPRIGLRIQIDPGPLVRLERIVLPGADRTDPSLVARLAGLTPGSPLVGFDAERIRQRLEEAGFFDAVGNPEVVVGEDSAAVLRIPVEEGDPGTFDLVLGYLPADEQSGEGRVIGNGHIALKNLFGQGRMLSLRLDRLPDQVSSVEVRASDPYILGLPLGASLGFFGIEQDSTYGKRAYSGELSVHLAEGMDLLAGFSREVTGPGQAGLRLSASGRQIIPASETWFFGVGARVSHLDRAVSPTRGTYVEMILETGRKERSERRVVESDTTRVATVLDQRRLRATARAFLSPLAKQVLVFGGDGAVLLSNEYDRSDLYRFGGATTLRGYDEDQFLGRIAARLLFEYRFLIDRTSYAYGFFDLGYIDRPATPDLAPERGTHLGYGIGIQFETVVGLINVSAALNPESGPTDARIHAGLSFGL